MSSKPADTGGGRREDGGAGRRGGRGRRLLGWLSMGLAAVLVVGSLTAYGFYWRLQHNIRHEDTDGLIGGHRPKRLNGALNILMLGTDGRDGANARYGPAMKDGTARSDTMVLLHLSRGGGRATGVSLPRDLMVPIPACARPDGGRSAPVPAGMLNSSFTLGGASCAVKTVEGFAGVRIDHFLQVDFTGFKSVTEAVGGVEVCLPRDVDDRDSKLRLGRGRHVVKGETALAYVRNRHGLGDGSDLQRIERQQRFMGALAAKVLSAGTLSDPRRLLSLAEAGTRSLTTDKGLDLGTMMRIAQGMRGLTAGRLRFVTVPVAPYPADPNRVALRRPDGDRFFAALRADAMADDPAPSASPAPAAGGNGPPRRAGPAPSTAPAHPAPRERPPRASAPTPTPAPAARAWRGRGRRPRGRPCRSASRPPSPRR
ncbi:LCP family protein [Actinomadura sp. J1-007]|uniref:LCP family protein n=1 Tax=Actinomadura sp. J1-007 TaxID=2661913 RepID=UPI00136CEEA3|nr:LCP family protein [Actinomadura sp. J1-007]